jgi:hypothetical protein
MISFWRRTLILVAADRVHGAACVRAPEDEGCEHPEDDHDHDGHREPSTHGLAEPGHRARLRQRDTLGQHQGKAPGDRQHRHGGDERRKPAVGDQNSGGQTGQDAGDHAEQDRDHRVETHHGGAVPGHDRREGCDRAHGQIDAGRDDHERLAESEDGHNSCLDPDVEHVLRREEDRAEEGHHSPEQDQRHQGAVLARDGLHAREEAPSPHGRGARGSSLS